MRYVSLFQLLMVLFVLMVIRLGVAGFSLLSPDEAYYWLWSTHLDYGFYDHPPMVALWIKAGCWLWGKTAFGVRFLAPFAALLGSVFIFFATLDFSGFVSERNRNAVVAVLLLNATLAIGIGSVTMTPDTPLLFFICVFIWTCGRLRSTENPRWWIGIGMAAGCALLSKYTAVLMILALGIWCFCTVSGRCYLKNGFFWLGGMIACLLFSPVVFWNARHQWISFVKQGGRTADWDPHRAVQFVLELLGGQVGLATPLVFLCFFWAFIMLTYCAWKKRQENALLLWLFVMIPICVFFQHALGDRVQANWVGILYPVLAMIAGIYGHRWLKAAVVTGMGIGMVVYVQTVFLCFPVPVKLDMTLKRLGGWENLVQDVNKYIPAHEPVIIDEYGLASELAFYGNRRPIILVGKRWRYFPLQEYAGKQGYLIRTQRRKDAPPPFYFTHFDRLGTMVRQQDRKVIESYTVYKTSLSPSDENRKEVVALP